MMDLALDSKQSKALDCSDCDPNKQKLRNCANKFGKSQSPILVNGQVYRQCPRSLVIDKWELGYLVSLYFDCKENKTNPFPGSLLEQTTFCKKVFEFMDDRVEVFRNRQDEELRKKMEKNNKPASKGPKVPRRK